MKNRGCERSDFVDIKRIIWVKEDTVYKDLRRIMYNEETVDSSEGDDEDEGDDESDDVVDQNGEDSESNDDESEG
jgi:hypothetical protein